MFPNPQDALPLPPRPSLNQYKKLAKDLVKACKSDDAGAIRTWAKRWVDTLMKLTALAIPPDLPVHLDRWVNGVEEFARRRFRGAKSDELECTLSSAQFVIARSHGFESWPRFAQHLEELAGAHSPISNFEAAADAVISGDIETLESLLAEDPKLARQPSTREHGAALLHYVSANGVEGYRQRTPRNAVKIAELLLNAGADVNATASVYGGGATALGLVATSVHPERAGVQRALMELLLAHGALPDSPAGEGLIVNACLANGRPRAAEFLADRGAHVDLEAAAGMGALDRVKSYFRADGSLQSGATKTQLDRGFLWACEYGYTNVIEYLLDHGADPQAQAGTGHSALHWAVIGGHLDTIQLLLSRGASLEATNAYGGTALGQALWSAVNGDPARDHAKIVEVLLEAGAKVTDSSIAWLERQTNGSASMKERVAEVLRRHVRRS
ncbi:MAG TPA: ankyrin repeat domain-containing protein [Candidatus Sulfotelmatobacter sp.]|nr:ankyrin repeat domain-containing protein [Candidatus Sulfotelmatobacter sp.]